MCSPNNGSIDLEEFSQLISDERLSAIEGVVCNNLNEECTPAKVWLSTCRLTLDLS
jgi:hypothetical protein